MFSFFKRNKNEEKVPEWANFFKPREYRAFIAAVDHYFQSAGIEYENRDGTLFVGTNDHGFDRLGLLNLAQRCLQQGPNHYQDIVKGHFDMMANSRKLHEEIDQIAESFDAVKRYLGVRIYPSDQIESLGTDSIMARKIAEGIHAVVVFDLPEVIMNVSPGKTENWGLTFEEIYQKGLRNIRKNYEVDITKQELGPHGVWLGVSDHFFTANIVLDLSDKYLGDHGALVAIPNRHAVFIYPINSLEVIQVTNLLPPIISGMYEKGPGSITDHLYLYQSGSFTNIPYQLHEDKLEIHPPAAFTDLLNKLAE